MAEWTPEDAKAAVYRAIQEAVDAARREGRVAGEYRTFVAQQETREARDAALAAVDCLIDAAANAMATLAAPNPNGSPLAHGAARAAYRTLRAALERCGEAGAP